MSFNLQSNLFAKLLSNKLENLDLHTNLSRSADFDDENLTKLGNATTKIYPDKYRWIWVNGIGSCDRPQPSKMSQDCSFLGTTFPPNKFVSCDLVRAKFQKESLLLRQVQKRNKKGMEMETPSRPIDIPRDPQSADSELFFDFDIGSPGKDETDSYVNESHDEDDMELDHLSFSFTTTDNPLVNYSRSLNSPEDSITYQSTSSGLFSQSYSPSPTEKESLSGLDELDEKTLFPEEWFKNHFSVCDDLTPKVLSPVLSSQDISYNFEITQSPDQESKMVKDPVWNGEMTIASDKLEALIGQLQTDSGARLIHTSKNYSTSPANFSYLKGSINSVNVSDDDKHDKIKTISKSCSLYEISDFEKSSFSEPSPIGGASGSEVAEKGASCEDLKEKYRKCSSLRSGKTPPNTPRGRKIVRFADIFGLDLADVKTFLDDIPKVPKSAFKDLKDADISDMESDSGSDIQQIFDHQQERDLSEVSRICQSSPALAPLFNQPGGSSEFFNVLRDKRVCLENVSVVNQEIIKGIVRVVNLDFNKKVLIRYSFDEWMTSAEVEASYLQGSCDGFSDKFTFSIDYKQISGTIGKRLHFCIKYECLGFEYWDNNQGRNYTFQMFGPTTTQPLKTQENMMPFVTRISNRRSFRHRSSPVNLRPANSTTHFETFSHSPSTTDDPWLRY